MHPCAALARFRGSARAHRGTTPRASSSLPAPKRVPAREHHSAAGARNSRTVERPHETRAHQAQLDAGTAKPLHLEHSKMARRCALAAVTCIAATNAFVAPTRSVARPSSSHAQQPTTPAAMRQQTYACSARIKGLRARLKHISRDAIDATTTRRPRRRLTR